MGRKAGKQGEPAREGGPGSRGKGGQRGSAESYKGVPRALQTRKVMVLNLKNAAD